MGVLCHLNASVITILESTTASQVALGACVPARM